MPSPPEEHEPVQRPATLLGKVLPLLFSLLLCAFGAPALGGAVGVRALSDGASPREAVSHNGERPVTDQPPASRKIATRWAQSVSPTSGWHGGAGGPGTAAVPPLPFAIPAPGTRTADAARDGALGPSGVPRASLGRAPPSTRL
jgi:hypothetical protein